MNKCEVVTAPDAPKVARHSPPPLPTPVLCFWDESAMAYAGTMAFYRDSNPPCVFSSSWWRGPAYFPSHFQSNSSATHSLTLPDEMPPRDGFILPEILVLAGLSFRRRCHYSRRCHHVLGFLKG